MRARDELKAAAKTLHAIVRRAMNEADPARFMAAEFPEDEYDPEVSRITGRINSERARSPEAIEIIIRDVWTEMIDVIAPSQEDYFQAKFKKVAAAISAELASAKLP